MAGSTPEPPLKVFLYCSIFSGTGCSSVRVVHLTGEHFGIIIAHNLNNLSKSQDNKNQPKKTQPWFLFPQLSSSFFSLFYTVVHLLVMLVLEKQRNHSHARPPKKFFFFFLGTFSHVFIPHAFCWTPNLLLE